jgi:cellulose synthase/poly-beta-1,6-N-acetylglucosamine synthase-like glycosyltransferase
LVLAKSDSRIRVLKQENRGSNISRIVGVRHARADWITFVDSDDELLEDHLKSLWAAVNEDVGIVVGGFSIVEPDGRERKFELKFRQIDNIAAIKMLLTLDHNCGLYQCWNKLYSKSLLIGSVISDDRINYGEDQIFNLRSLSNAENKAVIGIKLPTYRYLLRNGSIMRSITHRHVDDFFFLWDELESYEKKYLNSPAERLLFRNRRSIMLIDFFGVMYRAEDRQITANFIQKIEDRGWDMRAPRSDLKAILRWLKFRLRFFLAINGFFLSVLK